MPYLTIDPRELQPGDRIPDLNSDGPTVAAVGTPVPSPEHGHLVPVTFTAKDSQGNKTRELPTAMGVYVWRPDPQKGTP